MVRLVFCLWLAVSGFALSQRQATSKVSIDIFVRFPLASSAGRSAYTVGLLPPAAKLRKKLIYQFAGPSAGVIILALEQPAFFEVIRGG